MHHGGAADPGEARDQQAVAPAVDPPQRGERRTHRAPVEQARRAPRPDGPGREKRRGSARRSSRPKRRSGTVAGPRPRHASQAARASSASWGARRSEDPVGRPVGGLIRARGPAPDRAPRDQGTARRDAGAGGEEPGQRRDRAPRGHGGGSLHRPVPGQVALMRCAPPGRSPRACRRRRPSGAARGRASTGGRRAPPDRTSRSAG